MKLRKLLFTLAIILLFGSSAKAAGKNNILFIGDSRTVGLQDMYSDLSKKSDIKQNNKVTFVAKVGAGYNDYFQSLGDMRDPMYDALEKLNEKDNAKCIVWLGVNDCGYNDRPKAYADAINRLARAYKNVDFTVAMVTGVDESYYNRYVNNSLICSFDSEYYAAVKDASRYGKNLHVAKMYNKFKDDIAGNTVDGLHYTAKFSKKILKHLVNKVNE